MNTHESIWTHLAGVADAHARPIQMDDVGPWPQFGAAEIFNKASLDFLLNA